MEELRLDLGEDTGRLLESLAQRCGTTPGHVVELLCREIDADTMARIAERAIARQERRLEPGVARVPLQSRFPRRPA